MSHLSEYMNERLGHIVLEKDHGFVAFEIRDKTCFIHEIFIEKQKRLSGLGKALADEVALVANGQGCKSLMCTVFNRALNATESLKAVLAYGFSLVSCDSQYIYFRKDI